MLQLPTSPVPFISISFAPPELPPVEPKSPFSATLPEEPDSPRPLYLLPPLPLSPLRPLRKDPCDRLPILNPTSPRSGKGLEREHFEAMLRASKERSAMLGAKRPVELRKEIAMKVQETKQSERRARFLSKLVAPPSPTATSIPVTPPDSPAIFHFSLPSPGLVSPLELFEEVTKHPEMYICKTKIELVDFRLPQQKQAAKTTLAHRTAATGSLPSLDQISERLSRSPALIGTTRSPPEHGSSANNRLPSFLRSRIISPSVAEASAAVARPPETDASKQPPPVLPALTLSVPKTQIGVSVRTPTPITTEAPLISMLPPSPKPPPSTKLQIVTSICPLTKSKSSPTEFTEANVTAFGSRHCEVAKEIVAAAVKTKARPQTQRVQASRDLIMMLSRRTTELPGATACGIRARDDTYSMGSSSGTGDKLRRRLTAPAEMSPVQRQRFWGRFGLGDPAYSMHEIPYLPSSTYLIRSA